MSKNVYKVVIITFCQRFHLYIHAYALLLISRGLNLIQVSTIESVVIGTIFLMEVPTGVIADWIGRKWSLVVATALLMTAEFVFIFARSYPVFVVIGALTGTAFAFLSGAVEALVYESLPETDRDNLMKRAMGQINGWGQIAFFIAPVAGAIIIGDATPERFTLAIASTVAALFIGVIVSLTLDDPSADWDADRSNPLQTLHDGVTELRHSPQLRRIAMLMIFTSPFTGSLIGTFAAPYLTQNAVSPFMVGIALSVGSLLSAGTQRHAYKIEQWLGQRTAVTVLILLPGMMYIILAMISGPALALLIVIFMYATNDMKAPLFSAYQNALIGQKNRATVLSIINMFVSLFLAIGAPIYATIALNISFEAAFISMGTVIVAAALIMNVYRLPVNKPVEQPGN